MFSELRYGYRKKFSKEILVSLVVRRETFHSKQLWQICYLFMVVSLANKVSSERPALGSWMPPESVILVTLKCYNTSDRSYK